jgi:hypothetical protein
MDRIASSNVGWSVLALALVLVVWAPIAEGAPSDHADEGVQATVFRGPVEEGRASELADAELAAIRGRYAPPISGPARTKRKVILWDEALVEDTGPGPMPLGAGNVVRLRGGGL